MQDQVALPATGPPWPVLACGKCRECEVESSLEQTAACSLSGPLLSPGPGPPWHAPDVREAPMSCSRWMGDPSP